jgi:DNA-binding NarL/FixJ family response regulator
VAERSREGEFGVGRGTTREEIAAQLSLSRKTVTRHHDPALRKLGAGPRTAPVVRLAEEARERNTDRIR